MGCCFAEKDTDYSTKWDAKVKRSCTDLFCLILFVLYVAAMGCISAYAIYSGGASRLIYGMDSFGNICGQKNQPVGSHSYHGLDMTNRKFVYFFDFTAEAAELVSSELKNTHSLEACVSRCPDGIYDPDYKTRTAKEYLYQEYVKEGNNLCFLNYDQREQNFDARSKFLDATNGKNGQCPKLPIPATVPILNRCIPKNVGSDAKNVAEFLSNIPTIEKVAMDVYACRYTLLYCSLISVGVSVISVLLLRFLASILVWIVIGGMTLCSLAGTALMWYAYAVSEGTVEGIAELEELVTPLSSHDDILYFAIGVTIFSFLMICFAIAAVSRAKLAAALFAEAGKVVAKIPFLMLQAFWMYITLMALWSAWVLSVAFLATSGSIVVDQATGYVTTDSRNFWWAYLIQIFGVIWLTEVVVACHQFMLSAATARYYFYREKQDFGSVSPLMEAFLSLITYHLGSICFGSLLVALLRIPQAICSYIYHKAKAADSKIGKCAAKCCMCCLCCFEKILRYFNSTSYAMIAITGQNYCRSACMGASTLASNAFRVGAIAVLGGLTLFLGKVLVASISAICAGVMVKTMAWHPEVNSLVVPIVIAFIVGYVVASGFYATFSTTVNTLLLCFCEDCRINDGSESRPYFMGRSLMKFVQSADAQIQGKLPEGEREPLRAMR